MTTKHSLLCISFAFTLMVQTGCDKSEDEPQAPNQTISKATVITYAADYISNTSARMTGEVTSAGGAKITEKGICFSTSSEPTLDDTKISSGEGTGEAQVYAINLLPSTKYYVRAYAINSAGTAYGNEITLTTSNTAVIQNGYYYQGGFIFYIDGTGNHGMVCAPFDQGTYNWGCEGTSISGTSSAIGTGMSNTTKILSGCFSNTSAACICYNLTLLGYSDWYLPSKDELDLMHTNLHLNKIGGFDLKNYWSSTQYNANLAWYQLFNLNKNQIYYDKDLIPYSVRAVRNF